MTDIRIRGLRKSFGKNEIVRGVDLDVRDGEFVVILGPSGCGKSTLLRLIAGLEEVTAGEVAIGGTIVNDMEPRQRNCAMVFQNYALYPHMTVAENIGYALKVAGVASRERAERIAKVAKTLELDGLLDRKPAALSGGQRQRVAMGRAMIREPSVFLFDEPLSNLDAKLRVQMRVEIRRLHQRLKATSVFVTHDQVEAMTLADKLVVMKEGLIEQIGAPADVYRQPSSRYVAGFIGSPAMNFFSAEVLGSNRIGLGPDTSLTLSTETRLPAAGNLVTIGIRPEDLQLTERGDTGVLPFDVDLVEELGAGRLLHGRLAGTDCVIATPRAIPASFGGTLFVHIAPNVLHFFDRGTGNRINSGH